MARSEAKRGAQIQKAWTLSTAQRDNGSCASKDSIMAQVQVHATGSGRKDG